MPPSPIIRTLAVGFMLCLSGLTLGCSTGSPESRAISAVTQLVEGLQSGTEKETTQPTHLMTNAAKRTGWIRMSLKHGSPSEEHWVNADKDAESKCRDWGYREAEVTGTNHVEILGSSSRTYECRGKVLESPAAALTDKPETPVSHLTTAEVPTHQMTLSFPRIGLIQMLLAHESPSNEHWANADREAQSQCREWGYDEAEVDSTVMNTRHYQCRGRSNSAAAGQQVDRHNASVLELILEWRRTLASFRNRAEQGDEKAQAILAGMANRQTELQRRAADGNQQAQGDLAFLRFLTSDKQLRVERWRCFSLLDYERSKPALTLGRLKGNGNEHGIGEVLVSGTAHIADFRVAGIDLRWDFGDQNDRGAYPYAFTIGPDGTGAYYDFSASTDGRARPRQVFECRLSP